MLSSSYQHVHTWYTYIHADKKSKVKKQLDIGAAEIAEQLRALAVFQNTGVQFLEPNTVAHNSLQPSVPGELLPSPGLLGHGT